MFTCLFICLYDPLISRNLRKYIEIMMNDSSLLKSTVDSPRWRYSENEVRTIGNIGHAPVQVECRWWCDAQINYGGVADISYSTNLNFRICILGNSK